jgi:hypothetical protein
MEQWKNITGAEGYEVSNLGRIRNKKTRHVLKTWINNSGYECIKIKSSKVKFRDTVHRVVAKEFCTGFEEGLVVNHKDADRVNNTSGNLEWVTTKENIHDMRERGTLNTHSAREAHLKNLYKKVDMYSADGTGYLKTFNSLKEAQAETGTSSSKISAVVRGNRFRAGGYHWKYHNPEDNYAYYRKGVRN